jgi:hypothetical protein
MFFAAAAVFAQNAVSLDAEIQNVEKIAAGKGISAAERHDAFVRLARLRQLSGDIEGAAKNWLEAAAAIPGNVDDDALLMCACCLAAMGEWDRASAALAPLLAKSARARFFDASIKAVKTGDVSMLGAIESDPQYLQMRSQIFFMLWKTSSAGAAEIWRQRLAAEFPQSPEGRLASETASPAIIVRPSPFWLLMGGLDPQPAAKGEGSSANSLPVVKSETAAAEKAASPAANAPQPASASPAPAAVASQSANAPQPAIANPVPVAVVSQAASAPQPASASPAPVAAVSQSANAPQPASANPVSAAGASQSANAPQRPPAQAAAVQSTETQTPPAAVRLQTGLYSIHANAQAQMENLKKAGFPPTLEQRGDKWAVTVPAAADMNRAIKELKDAGFDSFPIK